MSEVERRSVEPAEVVRFWREAGADRWFNKDPAFDDEFRRRFLDLHMAAARRELDGWAATPEGMLALLILLDQFPRNCFRGSGHMYATDALARRFATAAIESGQDQAVEPELRPFCYLPFGHSEALADQDRSVALMAPLGPDGERYSKRHRSIVARFGRFPHRNRMLGRETTAEEQAFLDEGGFAG